MHTIERYHDICAGHRVYGHESKCAHLHGHNYRVTFTCAAELACNIPVNAANELDHLGRVIDFSVVKSTLCQWLEDQWDHKFLLWEEDPLVEVLDTYDPKGLVVVPFNPTAENLAQHLVDVVGPLVLKGTGVRLTKVRIEETRKCSATYEIE